MKTYNFRSAPRHWVIIANTLTVVVDLTHPAVVATMIASNEPMFAGLLLTSKALQTFGLYNGKNKIISK